MEETLDCAIVGAGVAGLSAALFLARAGRKTVVFDGGPSRIYAVNRVREYSGFDGMSPGEMLHRARQEAAQYGADIRSGQVERVVPREDGFFDVFVNGQSQATRTVVLATGLTDELPNLEGMRSAWGEDLRVCPCFDGFEVRNKRFVVFGVGERLAHMASWVRMWSPDVTIVTRHVFNEVEAERLALLQIRVVEDEITGLVHEEETLTAVTTEGGQLIDCDATWVTLRSRAASDLAASLCDIDDLGFAKTQPSGATSRPGVFAIGNADEPWAHLAHAAASGTTVGPVVTMYLLEQQLSEMRSQMLHEAALF